MSKLIIQICSRHEIVKILLKLALNINQPILSYIMDRTSYIFDEIMIMSALH